MTISVSHCLLVNCPMAICGTMGDSAPVKTREGSESGSATGRAYITRTVTRALLRGGGGGGTGERASDPEGCHCASEGSVHGAQRPTNDWQRYRFLSSRQARSRASSQCQSSELIASATVPIHYRDRVRATLFSLSLARSLAPVG